MISDGDDERNNLAFCGFDEENLETAMTSASFVKYLFDFWDLDTCYDGCSELLVVITDNATFPLWMRMITGGSLVLCGI